MSYQNPNKGMTKEALKQSIRRGVEYYVAQFGPRWAIDALLEVAAEYQQRKSTAA